MLPSKEIEKRISFENKVMNCYSLLYYFNIRNYANVVSIQYL